MSEIIDRFTKYIFVPRFYLLLVTALGTATDVFLFRNPYWFVTFPLFFMWMWSIKSFKLPEKTINSISQTMFIGSVSFLVIGLESVAEKMAIWMLIFLVSSAFMRYAAKVPSFPNS